MISCCAWVTYSLLFPIKISYLLYKTYLYKTYCFQPILNLIKIRQLRESLKFNLK